MTAAVVFVVDDDPSVRKSLSRVVRSAGYTVEAFASARDFMARGPCGGPCCVVLDVRMPGLTGLDLQEALVGAGRPMPVVFITGHGDISMSVKAMKAGAVDFLTKPFDVASLLAAIERASWKRCRRDRWPSSSAWPIAPGWSSRVPPCDQGPIAFRRRHAYGGHRGHPMNGVPIIAIVDDDPSVRRSLLRVVQSAGYVGEAFASAREFLAWLPRGQAACLVLDAHMDEMSGFDLHDRLTVPIVFISGHDDAQTLERIAKSHAAGHLRKPFDRETVLDTIDRAVGGLDAARPAAGAPTSPGGLAEVDEGGEA